MREMTIDEVHKIALDIMVEIHEFCVANNIQYSLAYGSLIGAIRHKGFIPWDDDIDVWMTRPNFEKFTKLYKSKHGYRLSSEYDDDSLICFNRVYETEITYLKRGLKSCNGSVGVWVDIMPLDGVPEEEAFRKEQYSCFCNMNRTLTIARFWLNYIETVSGFKRFYGKSRLMLNNIAKGNYKSIKKQMVDISTQYDFFKGTLCCFFQCGSAYTKRKQELLPVDSFGEYRLVKFENTEMMVIADYDNVLKGIYGDYMKLPPVEDRTFHHGVVYWK